MKKKRRAGLRSLVRTLAVELGGIVVFPEYFQQFLVGKFRRIVLHFDGFGVAGAVAADVLVSRIGEVPTRITNPGCRDPRQLAKRGFNSPETACGESGFGHRNKTPHPDYIDIHWMNWRPKSGGGGSRKMRSFLSL